MAPQTLREARQLYSMHWLTHDSLAEEPIGSAEHTAVQQGSMHEFMSCVRPGRDRKMREIRIKTRARCVMPYPDPEHSTRKSRIRAATEQPAWRIGRRRTRPMAQSGLSRSISPAAL